MPEWTAAKENFTKKTDQQKPAKTFGKIRFGTGIEAVLKDMDKIYVAAVKEGNAAKRLKMFNLYGKKIDDFAKKRQTYKKQLEEAASKEPGETQLVKEIAVLSKQLSATEAGARDNLKTQQISCETELNPNKVDKHDKEANKVENVRVQAQKIAPALKASVKAGALFAAKVKASPTAETFNYGIQNAARKITQNLGWVEKIDAVLHKDLGVNVDQVNRAVQVLEPWGKGARKLKDDATEKEVLRELNAYVNMLKSVQEMVHAMENA